MAVILLRGSVIDLFILMSYYNGVLEHQNPSLPVLANGHGVDVVLPCIVPRIQIESEFHFLTPITRRLDAPEYSYEYNGCNRKGQPKLPFV